MLELRFLNNSNGTYARKAGKNNVNISLLLYVFFLLVFFFVSFFDVPNFTLTCLAIFDILLSFCVLTISYKNTGVLFSPSNVVCITWGILIPISSFSFPVMDAMSSLSWNRCLIAELIALCTCLLFQKQPKHNTLKHFYLTSSEERCLIGILILSIIIILYLFYKIGFSAPSSSSVSSLRTEVFFPGYNILSNFGTIAIPSLLANEKKHYKKAIYLLSIFYLLLLLLSAIRFAFIMCLVLSASYFVFVKKKHLKALLFIGLIIIFAFLFANSIRRGDNSIDYYFINTGIYTGSVRLFNLTEIFRYLGYSQRLIEKYESISAGGENHGLFTLYPLLKFLFIEPKMVSTPNIYGYNACNIITFLYADFGILWPVGILVFFGACTFAYNCKIKSNSFLSSYCWSIGLFAMLFSFYSYIFQYVYWVTIYPLIFLVIHLIFGSRKNVKI